jgi:hypothetical protein
MVVTLAYLAFLGIGALCIAVRHGPILLKGRSVLWLNGIAFGAHLVFRPSPARVWLPLFAIIFGVSWFGVHTWFVVKEDPATLANAIETRLRRVLVEFSRDQNGYHLSFNGKPATIRFRRILPRFQALTFSGNWQDNRAKVAQRFLSKYGEPLFPRPRIRV